MALAWRRAFWWSSKKSVSKTVPFRYRLFEPSLSHQFANGSKKCPNQRQLKNGSLEGVIHCQVASNVPHENGKNWRTENGVLKLCILAALETRQSPRWLFGRAKACLIWIKKGSIVGKECLFAVCQVFHLLPQQFFSIAVQGLRLRTQTNQL